VTWVGQNGFDLLIGNISTGEGTMTSGWLIYANSMPIARAGLSGGNSIGQMRRRDVATWSMRILDANARSRRKASKELCSPVIWLDLRMKSPMRFIEIGFLLRAANYALSCPATSNSKNASRS
jgi:hypothetical protein